MQPPTNNAFTKWPPGSISSISERLLNRISACGRLYSVQFRGVPFKSFPYLRKKTQRTSNTMYCAQYTQHGGSNTHKQWRMNGRMNLAAATLLPPVKWPSTALMHHSYAYFNIRAWRLGKPVPAAAAATWRRGYSTLTRWRPTVSARRPEPWRSAPSRCRPPTVMYSDICASDIEGIRRQVSCHRSATRVTGYRSDKFATLAPSENVIMQP